MQVARIRTAFENQYKAAPSILVRAPGRINLIGEHTDYNNGFVLPAAIDKAIYFGVRKRFDNLLKFYAVDLEESYEGSLDSLIKSKKNWANYLIGVLKILKDKGCAIDFGLEVCFGGNIPLGAGLSSSAALESGFSFALNELFGLELTRKELALIAQQAEHSFAGVNCGIMDMYASLFGKSESVILLDCRSITHEYFPFDFPEYQLVLCNSGVKHNLGDSAYNTRRRECESGVEILKKINPAINSLRDVSAEFFTKNKFLLPIEIMKRCRYVVCENERVNWACQALLEGDLISFGSYLYQTHWGLANDYEVSSKELDFLVKITEKNEAVIGSRMMGGGFGGCTLNIVKKEYVNEFIEQQTMAYSKQFDLKLECYIVTLMSGTEAIRTI